MSFDRYCERCGGEMKPEQIPCPDNRPGCLTWSGRFICPKCDAPKAERTTDERDERVAALETRVDDLTAVVRYLLGPDRPLLAVVTDRGPFGDIARFDEAPDPHCPGRETVARMLNEWLDATSNNGEG